MGRLVVLGALIGIVAGALSTRRRRAAAPVPVGSVASWPPLTPSSESPVAALGDLATATDHPSEPAPGEPTAGGPAWVGAHDDGSCPLSHPIKANDGSHIYHLPDGRFYARTKAQRCYANAADAEADGYRAAKGAGGATTTPGGST